MQGEKSDCLICVDTGTTNTRVWLLRGAEVLATARVGVGVRDTAREGTAAKLYEALREAIASVSSHTIEGGGDGPLRVPEAVPQAVIAAGMITSPLGLREIPHLVAPAGLAALSAAVVQCHFPQITGLPFFLVPGVRSGADRTAPAEVGSTDVMRGEETLCLGLAASGLLGPRSTLLNLGSHWKLIRLDAETRIESSVTSLSGELIHATQTQTILAGSVPGSRPEVIDPEWMRFGMAEQRCSGTARALFCVRLLEQRSTSTPEERLAYLIGVYIAADLDAMLGRGLMVPGETIVIAGGEALAAAWATALAEHSIGARLLTDGEIEHGLLAGLRAIAASAIRFEDLKQEME